MTGAKVGKIIAYLLIVLVLIAGIGMVAYFTGGFTGEFKTFYVEVDGKQIMTNASGYKMTANEPMTVNVKYTMSDEVSGYSVKVVPNALEGKDFDFKLDEDVYSYQAEKDLTDGFIIEHGETSFTIKPKGGITEILQAIYPNNVVEDCRDFAYENMFTLVVTSYDGESSVTINFSVTEDISGIELDKEVIIFLISARVAKKLLLCVVAMAMVLSMVFPVFSTVAYAASDRAISYDSTNVLDDLNSSTVNGQPFDITDYPFNENKDIQVINFVEYCYSYKANLRDNYGLYVYIYNPKGLNLSTSEKQNKIQMAVSYDTEGNPTDYEKFSLEFCSKTESGDYKNLFYKFKVIDHEVNGTTFSDRVNSNARRYDVSGVELTTYGASSATDYGVCGTYIFSGFAEGYGPDDNAKSTLTCDVEYLETIELSVKHTFYRSETSALGAGHQNQLDTVYFSVPKRFIETYGRLQRIKAEWYEYKTKEILVTSNTDFYNAAKSYIGVPLGDTPNEFGMYEYVEDIGYSLGIGAGKAGDMYVARWGWNLGTGYLHVPTNALYYMFLVDNIEEYDPYAETVTIGGVQSNDLYEWIKNYNKSYASGRLPIKDGTISADLFEDDIDDSRKMNNENGVIKKGYSYYDFDADVDLQTLSSWSDSDPSFWDNWINFGLGAAFTGGPDEESKTVAPIQILKASDLTGTNTEIAERLLVNSADVDSIKAEYNNAVTVNGVDDEEMVVVLFRFATSDYYSEAADIIQLNKGFLWSDKHTEGQAYIAQESVFFDFDIIQLTFNKDGDYTVIPVVSSPIDIVNDITPPVNMPDELAWWQIVLAILMLVLLVVLLWPVLPYIGQGIWWVICLPVKAYKAIKNSIKRKREKDYYKEE